MASLRRVLREGLRTMALSNKCALISRRQLHAVQLKDAEEGFLLHDILLVYIK